MEFLQWIAIDVLLQSFSLKLITLIVHNVDQCCGRTCSRIASINIIYGENVIFQTTHQTPFSSAIAAFAFPEIDDHSD